MAPMAAITRAFLLAVPFLLIVCVYWTQGQCREKGACMRDAPPSGQEFLQHGRSLKQDVSELLSESRSSTFESARPGTCCMHEPSTFMTWSEFQRSVTFAANISTGSPIVVPCGHEVTIDQNISQSLPGLQVAGSVKFKDGVNIVMRTAFIFVCGNFSIGSPGAPHTANVEIVLVGGTNVTWPKADGSTINFGTAGFITYGGYTYLHGSACDAPAWTRLAQTVAPSQGGVAQTVEQHRASHDPRGNLALGRPAMQSSIGHHRYTADKAVDGSNNWKWNTMLTTTEDNPWWYVDMPSLSHAGIVTLTERSKWGVDLSVATVGLSNAPCQPGQLCGGTVCSHTMTRSGMEDFDCGGAGGDYLYVQLSGRTQLSISEVEVFAAASGNSTPIPSQAPTPHPSQAPTPSPSQVPTASGGHAPTPAPTNDTPMPTPAPTNDTPMPTMSPAPIPVGNLALGKPALQSSVGHHRYTAEKALDGRRDWKWSSMLTKTEENPWWYVHISSLSNVGTVTLSARGHRGMNLAGAIVGVAQSPCQPGKLCGGTLCSHTLTRVGREDFHCGGASGDYVYVQVNGTALLTMSEVEVYSAAFADAVHQLELQGTDHTAWKVGDKLMITSTSWDAEETEEAVVTSVSAQGVTVMGLLAHEHVGCSAASGCVMAAEVASMSRNIIIRGVEGCEPVCGHFMIAHTTHGFVCGVEFTNLGQTAVEGRYPLHVHMPGESPELVLKGNALHHNFNRGVVLHGVHNMTVESNLCFRTKGHCFMTEDAVEQYNIFRNNIGVLPSGQNFGCSHTHDMTFMCPGRSDGAANPFWISNPNNYFIGNLGITPGVAFNFETRHVTGKTRRDFPVEAKRVGSNGKIKGSTPCAQFSGNTAHSAGKGVNNYPRMACTRGGRNSYENFTAWRCGVGMGVHNSPGTTMPMMGSRLVENIFGVRGGLSDSRINLIENHIIASPLHSESVPLIVHKYETTSVAGLEAVFTIDNYTRSWVRCHGGYNTSTFLVPFDGHIGPCPPLQPRP